MGGHASRSFIFVAKKEDRRPLSLQARAVNDLHVDSKLAAVIGKDKGTDGATARLKGVAQTSPEVGLVNDRQTLLDVAGLSHGNDVAVLHVQNAVLLEDGAEHGLDNDARGGVGDKRRLLVQLAGEEVDTEVAVLTSGSRGRDADDLAGTALEHDKVANADVVAGDADGVGETALAIALVAAGSRGRAVALADLNVNVLLARVDNAVRQVVEALAEGVVVAVVVVVTHLLGRLLNGLGDADVVLGGGVGGAVVLGGELLDADAVLRLVVAGLGVVLLVGGLETLTVLALGDVDGVVVGVLTGVNLYTSVSEVVATGAACFC